MKSSFLTIVALIGFSPLATASEPGSTWDRVAAAKALDSRAQAWFDFSGSMRKTGEERVSCVSCHTTFFYAIARGRLRRSIGEKTPGPQESRLISEVSKRVENWEKLEPFYGGDKKLASRGTESVLDATVLSAQDAYQARTTPSPATSKAIQTLFSLQTRSGDQKGSWDWLDFGLEPWETSAGRYQGATLAAYAIAKLPAGSLTKADETQVDDLREYLSKNYENQTLHARSWLLFATPGLLGDARRDALVRDLLTKQRADGGWSLTDLGPWKWSEDEAPESSPHSPTPIRDRIAQSDGYATGLVVYALEKSGLKADRPELARGLGWLRTHQAADGSWPALSPNKDRDDEKNGGPKIARRFLSDAGTALAVMALLEADDMPQN